MVHKAITGEIRNDTRFWSGNLTGRNNLENLGVDGSIILELILG
jgi:hypothetical protein